MNNLSDTDIEKISVRVVQLLDQRKPDHEQHNKEHAFIGILMEREKREQERWEMVKTHVAKWGVIALIMSVFGGFVLYLKDHLK